MTANTNPRPPGEPVEHTAYLRRNLRLVAAGVKSRAPGIRRCTDCRDPWIADNSGLSLCPDCRVQHLRVCGDCHRPFTNTRAGDRLCMCCRDQHPLF